MSQKKAIILWRRTEYLLIKKRQISKKNIDCRNFLSRCYQLNSESRKS